MIRRVVGIAVLLSALFASVAPAAVPDGPRLAFLRVSYKAKAIELLTTDATGMAPELVVGGKDKMVPFPLPYPTSSIAWAPDGSALAFSGVTRPDGTLSAIERLEIFVVPSSGGLPRAVPGTTGALFPVMAPDGHTIAFFRIRGKGSSRATSGGKHHSTYARTSIWLTDIDGGVARQLTPWLSHARDFPSSFSPDGSTLAITHEPAPHAGSSSAEALNLETRRVTPIADDAASPVYSPDGSKIALLKLDKHGYRRDPHGGKEVAGVKTTVNLFVVNRSGGGLTQLTHGVAVDESPSWDPSGQRLAFVRLAPLRSELAVFGVGDTVMEVNADGTCETRIASSSNTAFESPIWQPGPGREAGLIDCGAG